MREQRKRIAVGVAVSVAVAQPEQLRERALPAGHRVQARADTLPQPNAYATDVGDPIDRSQRDLANPDPGADADTHTRGNAREVTLEWPHG